jgi:hypothetical protein
MNTKLEYLRKCQQDSAAAKTQKHQEYFQTQIRKAIISQGLTSPWSGRVNHAFAEVWEEEFPNLWEKTLSRLRAEIEIAKDEARTEAEDVLEETEPIAYG